MTRSKGTPRLQEVKARLAEDRDFLRPLVQAVLQELLKAEMGEALGAEKGSGVLLQLRERRLAGVAFVVSDDHAGLRQAIVEGCPRLHDNAATASLAVPLPYAGRSRPCAFIRQRSQWGWPPKRSTSVSMRTRTLPGT